MKNYKLMMIVRNLIIGIILIMSFTFTLIFLNLSTPPFLFEISILLMIFLLIIDTVERIKGFENKKRFRK